uniref:hypothetical protein n=1 Tax=Candidatus Electrothrix sp. TaxID=2170559 RepID=UPI0040572C4A
MAEMYAASLQGAEICYGVMTTGKAWEFGKFENNIFTKDPAWISATENLQKILEVLNWLFSQADTRKHN